MKNQRPKPKIKVNKTFDLEYAQLMPVQTHDEKKDLLKVRPGKVAHVRRSSS